MSPSLRRPEREAQGRCSVSDNSICEIREPLPGCVVVTVTGEVDAHSAPHLQETLLTALASASRRLVVDLDDVTFFDSAGIRTLITLRQKAGELADRVRLVMPRRVGVRRALDISAVDRLFE